MPLFSGFFSRKNIRTAVRSLVGDTASGGALETLQDALSLPGGEGTPNPPDGILFLSQTGVEASEFGWQIQNDVRSTATPWPDDLQAVVVRILGMTYNSEAVAADLIAAVSSTIAANKWGVYRLLAMLTHSDTAPHFSTRPAIAGEMAYDSEALALAAVPDAPWGCVSMGIFVIQATGAGFTAGTDNLTEGDGIAAITIHQPEVLA